MLLTCHNFLFSSIIRIFRDSNIKPRLEHAPKHILSTFQRISLLPNWMPVPIAFSVFQMDFLENVSVTKSCNISRLSHPSYNYIPESICLPYFTFTQQVMNANLEIPHYLVYYPKCFSRLTFPGPICFQTLVILANYHCVPSHYNLRSSEGRGSLFLLGKATAKTLRLRLFIAHCTIKVLVRVFNCIVMFLYFRISNGSDWNRTYISGTLISSLSQNISCPFYFRPPLRVQLQDRSQSHSGFSI